MVSPTLDTTFTFSNSAAGTTSTNAHAATNQTSGNNELVVAIIAYEMTSGEHGSSPTVQSVVESTGTLTFTQLAKFQNPTGAGANFETIEVWTAQATSQFNAGAASVTWTVTWSAPIDDNVVIYTAVQGLNSLTSPLDPNASIPATAANSTNTTPPAVTFSTTDADDLLLAIIGRGNCCGGWTTPSGWTNLTSNQNGGGLNGEVCAVDYKSVSATQTSASYQNAGTTADTSWTVMVLAFTADAGGGGGGGSGNTRARVVAVGF